MRRAHPREVVGNDVTDCSADAGCPPVDEDRSEVLPSEARLGRLALLVFRCEDHKRLRRVEAVEVRS